MKTKRYYIINDIESDRVHITGFDGVLDFNLYTKPIELLGAVENLKSPDYGSITRGIQSGLIIEDIKLSRYCVKIGFYETLLQLAESGVVFKQNKIFINEINNSRKDQF